jgi:hypothetical protein
VRRLFRKAEGVGIWGFFGIRDLTVVAMAGNIFGFYA